MNGIKTSLVSVSPIIYVSQCAHVQFRTAIYILSVYSVFLEGKCSMYNLRPTTTLSRLPIHA